jgi:rRNA-processing protein FCF1
MLIRPVPGNPPELIVKALGEAYTSAENLYTSHWSRPSERRDAYVTWANETARALHLIISRADIDRLVLTSAFWNISALPAATLSPADTQTIGTEIAARRSELLEVSRKVAIQVKRWDSVGHYLVPDTSMFIQHPDRLENWDLADVIGELNGHQHLLIPMAVVDELDRLKETNNQHVRWRARYSLAVLDRVLKDPTKAAVLRAADWNRDIDMISVEIVFDAPGHVRLPEVDDEIVDQVVMLDCLAGPRVRLLTYDTGLSTRARATGVECHKFAVPPDGDEPAKF